MIDKTVEYYNENADIFFETTVHVDMSLQLEEFEKLLSECDYVLDAGCGSGRDSLALKPEGVLYASFKQGVGERYRRDRRFKDVEVWMNVFKTK